VDEIEKTPTDELTLDVRRRTEMLQLKMRPVPLESQGVTKPRVGISWETGGQLSLSIPIRSSRFTTASQTLQTIGPGLAQST